jgi:hypothetical protein
MGAGTAYTLAALPDAEAPRLLAVVLADAEARFARSRAAFGPDAALRVRAAAESGARALETVAALWPSVARDANAAAARLRRDAPPAPAAATTDRRVPARNPQIVGPLNVYYYDYFADIPGADFSKIALASVDGGDVLAYEALNLADGRRTVSEIRDAVSGLYTPVPLAAIAEYFDLLAKAGVVTLR